MTPSSAICFGLAIVLIVSGNVTNSARLARSPQFGGGFSQAQASAQSGGYGFGRPRYFGPPGPPIRPGFGQGGYGQGGFGQGGYGQGGFGQGGYGQGGFGQGGFGQRGFGQGGSLSISKSVSISRGGAAQSSAQSGASGK